MPPRPIRHLCGATVLLAVASFGCAGELENPERFTAPSTGGDGGGGGGCTLEVDVVQDLFVPKCGNAACHGEGASLDLITEGWADRLVGVAAPEDGMCPGEIYVDPADIDSSLLIAKLHEDTVTCGSRMPLLVDPLSDEEIACVKEWAAELGPGAGGGGDGGMPAGDAGGDGGT